jgi:hypothetical protein
MGIEGDAVIIHYVFTGLCAAVFFANDVRDWTGQDSN